MAETPVVRKLVATNDPAVQIEAVTEGTGRYSHDEELPLKLRVKRTGWFTRRISVTTLEQVWYRDAIQYIEVPAGFTYDLASIPVLVWFIVSPWDVAIESLFHDLLYRTQKVKRRVADNTMLSMMQDRGVPFLIRWVVYLGVRMGGWVAWKNHAARNAQERAAADAKAAAEQAAKLADVATDAAVVASEAETEAHQAANAAEASAKAAEKSSGDKP